MDIKSKMPDLKELASMTGKLFKDIKTSVGEIIQEYKENRAAEEAAAKAEAEMKPQEAATQTTEVKSQEPVTSVTEVETKEEDKK